MSTSSYIQYLLDDLFRDIPNITARAMFGGYGLYCSGVIFAIVVQDQLYFKVDTASQKEFEAYGSQPFVYHLPGRKKPTTMPYWQLPAEVMDDPEKLRVWTERSVQISIHKKSAHGKK